MPFIATNRGTISVEVKGYNRVSNALRPLMVKKAGYFDPEIYKWMQGTRAALKSTPYAPKMPNQVYVRTGRLANSWYVHKFGIAQYAIKNRTHYAGYVVGTVDQQAMIHKYPRWWNAPTIIQDRMPKLRAAIYKKAEDIL